MKKSFVKIMAVVLCMTVILAPSSIGVFAADDVDYAITNPYDGVNWDTAGRYKADLHCHTTVSDGSNTLKEMIERHYDLGFDIVSITDHGTVNYSWTEKHYVPELKVVLMVKDGNTPVEVLKDNGRAENGSKYSVTTTDAGDIYVQTDKDGVEGHAMLRIPYGIENNPTSFNNAHVNSWFADYGDGILGGTSDYETPIKNIDALGGLSVINHPGEYTNARDEVYTADAYNTDTIHYNYVVKKFESLLMKYDTCLGIDVNSKGDSRTRFDRKLWDIMLTDLTPAGRNIFALGSSDAHNLDIVNSGYDIIVMDELTVDNTKAALAAGSFFAGSCYIGNLDELKVYSDGLYKSNSVTAQTLAGEMAAAVEAIENEIETRGEQGTKYKFDTDKPIAEVTDITVDEAEDVISIEADGAYYIRWIADGKTVAEGNSVDLDDISDKLGTYIRAEIIGEGGILYSQPFMLAYDGASEYSEKNFYDFGSLVTFICDTFIRWLSNTRFIFEEIAKMIGI